MFIPTPLSFFIIALIIFVFIVCLCLRMRASKNQESIRNRNNNIYRPTLMNQTLLENRNQSDSHHINTNTANNISIRSQSRTLIRSMDDKDENSPPPSYDAVMGMIK